MAVTVGGMCDVKVRESGKVAYYRAKLLGIGEFSILIRRNAFYSVYFVGSKLNMETHLEDMEQNGDAVMVPVVQETSTKERQTKFSKKQALQENECVTEKLLAGLGPTSPSNSDPQKSRSHSPLLISPPLSPSLPSPNQHPSKLHSSPKPFSRSLTPKSHSLPNSTPVAQSTPKSHSLSSANRKRPHFGESSPSKRQRFVLSPSLSLNQQPFNDVANVSVYLHCIYHRILYMTCCSRKVQLFH